MRAFLFPGQGSQSVGMGAALAEASRAARDMFGEVDEALGQNLFKLMREGPEEELKLTENAQPAIMAHALAVFRALTREGGVSLDKAAHFVAGHSLGEYSALCAAGSFDLPTTAKLLKLRGQAMQAAVPVGVGAMAALLGADLELAQTHRRLLPPRARSAPSPTTMTRARSCFRATRARSTGPSPWPRTWAPSARCRCRCRRRSIAR